MNTSYANAQSNLRLKPLATGLAFAFGVSAAIAGHAATRIVNNCNDNGSGSLREAIGTAQSSDTIDLTGLTCSAISLTTGALQVAVDDLTLQGPGVNALTIAGSQVPNHTYGVLHHTGHGTLHIDALRITDSHAKVALPFGVSFCIDSTGNVDLDRSTVTACSSGGVFANGFTSRDSTISNNYDVGIETQAGNVSIESSTISGNGHSAVCGGLRLGQRGTPPTATALISNSTISGNAVSTIYGFYEGFGAAGCIYESAVTISNSTVAFNDGAFDALIIGAPKVTIESSIFAKNTSSIPAISSDLAISYGASVSGHNNLIVTANVAVPADTIKTDPQLLPLADNGGPTWTHALSPGSPAIDAGNNSAALATDQRGASRVAGLHADIGAFEVQGAANIGPDFTGSWFDPAQSGHGLMLEVLPDNQLLALWFAFDPAGDQQSWFGGVGTYVGNTATIAGVALPTGGRWIPNFNPNTIVRNPWGTLTFTFTDHDHGKVDFNSGLGYGSGSMELLRLTNMATQSAVNTSIGSPGAVTTDTSGNVYFSSSPNLVFKFDTQGKLTRIAGAGAAGYSGDGGPATQAQLNFPLSYPELVNDPVDYSELVGGLATDAAGNVYIADAYNNRVRKIDANGIITTVVGNGTADNSVNGAKAASAAIHWPQGVATDVAGNLYVSTLYASLQKITPDGIIHYLTGNNCGAGFLGPGLCAPEEIAIDAANNVFVADGYCRVRKVKPDGSVNTVAGADTHPDGKGSAFTCGYSGDGGPALNAALQGPYSVAVDSGGNLFIADTYNDCIRKVTTAQVITSFAGVCQAAGYSGDGGPATSARLDHPHGVAVDAAGNVYIADTNNNRIRKVSTAGIITTLAGNGSAGTIGPAFTGSWYDPAQSGHGLMLEVLPDNNLLALWFAFNPAGTQQVWFGGEGSYSGNTATITGVALPTGGRWIPNFDPDTVVRNPWGTLTFTFSDCNNGKVAFNSTFGYGTGSMNLSRLTLPAGLTCPQ